MRSANPRLRGFVRHLIGYSVIMIVLAVSNLLIAPDRPWFVWPLVAWMAPLAIHAAHTMHLFGKPRE
jgi:hypothetical protein